MAIVGGVGSGKSALLQASAIKYIRTGSCILYIYGVTMHLHLVASLVGRERSEAA